MTVTGAELRGGLRALGVRSGDRLIVHGSLSSFGHVDGGAETVVDTLIETVGEDGTVMAPSFTTGERPFERDNSPARTGRIPEELRTRAEAVRSDHPTHSVAALGAGAERFTRDHGPMNSLGPGSPMHRLIEAGGSILLLGVDHTSNSAVHIVERLENLPYRDQTRSSPVAGESIRQVTTNSVHCSYGFDTVEVVARRSGLITDGVIGEATVQLMDGNDLLSELVDVLSAVPGFVLCDDPNCDRCTYARECLAEEGLIELRND